MTSASSEKTGYENHVPDRNLAMELVRVTEAASIAATRSRCSRRGRRVLGGCAASTRARCARAIARPRSHVARATSRSASSGEAPRARAA